MILLSIIIISARLISLSPTPKIRDKMVGIIREARNLCLDWKSKIESLLTSAHSMNRMILTLSRKNYLRFAALEYSLMVWIKIILRHLLSSSEDAKNWLQFMSKIYDIKILFSEINTKLSSFQRNLMRMVIQCMIDIENQFKVICNADKGKCLSEFAIIKWAEAGNGRFEFLEQLPGLLFL